MTDEQATGTAAADVDPNAGFLDDMRERFHADPGGVDPSWRSFFEGSPAPAPSAPATGGTAPAPPATASPAPAPSPPPAPAPTRAPQAPLVLEGEEPQALRGAAVRIVENMEASLDVPTATSVRTVPAKLLETNRQILNNHLARMGSGKVSFTHLIAFAALQAIARVPAMSASYGIVDGQPSVVRHDHVNLGIAVDVERRGGRTLLVPNIKAADTLDFAAFHAAYEELIRRVKTNKLAPDDFAATTATVTNPGTIGTVHSVPRLMPGQGFILGVGAIGFPAEFEGADPATIARLGVSKTITLTSTYDHRVIQGAESGELLAAMHHLLAGTDDLYDEVFRSFGVPYEPARWSVDIRPADDAASAHEKAVHVQQIINMYRVRGHLIANLDPLGRKEPATHPELDINAYDLTIWDLDRLLPTGGLAGRPMMRLRDILGLLRDAYARTIGVEYMHIQEPDQKAWIQERVEGVSWSPTDAEKRRILERLNAAEAFERFLHTKFLGHKRFSLEGAETVVPMLDALLSTAADDGITDAVLGMPHRGRLNVLANVVGKSYGQIFREFEGELDPTSAQGSGDVKYHVGATGKHASPDGNELVVALASNPSHLEAVDPVVEGMVRARQDLIGDEAHTRVLPVLLHGDAAFAGQGVIAETFNLSEVPGYDVGGTVHLVVNNQLGFTTAPELGRSTVYATDVAKMVQAPIFHVNGDDPEACVRVIRFAFDFRQRFHKDVVVDLLCYRRYGHNELDEPAFTQPRMYELIEAHPSPRARYTEQLVRAGDMTEDEAEAVATDLRARLDTAFEETRRSTPPDPEQARRPEAPGRPERVEPAAAAGAVATGVAHPVLEQVVNGLTRRPDGFTVHPKLDRLLQAHRSAFDADQVDWALGEALAFGSLVLEGVPVRVAGQDTRRGTFSQRHSALVDQTTEAEHVPLAHLSGTQAPFMIYDSVLSEFAALGFEYGYSISNPDALVCWEAQFGDFMNGAQIIIDQFMVAAEDKWGQHSALALLLPHGFEGQGPEHSSARIERFLALCAEDNLRVVYPSTAAQYFHMLRRQALATRRVPLVCFTPKRYLRMAQTRSPVDAFTGGEMATVLDDRAELDPETVRRVLLSSGKIGHELMDTRDEMGAPAAVLRVEQLYPWPEERLVAAIDRYPEAREVWWAQEEPANMGAWGFVQPRLARLLDGRDRFEYVAREPSASPATGSQTVHDREQAHLLTAAFAGLT